MNLLSLVFLIALSVAASQCQAAELDVLLPDISVKSSSLIDEKKLKQLPVVWANMLDGVSAKTNTLSDIFSEELTIASSVRFDFTRFLDLQSWFKQRQVMIEKSAHLVSNIELTVVSSHLYQLSFEYVVEEQLVEQPTNIFRLQQQWLIKANAAGEPRVFEIKATYMSPKINSGAQIQC